MRVFRSDDSGAVLPIVAILLVVLLLVAAFVIDLGGVRVERAANQVIADAASSAAAVTAGLTRDGKQVCEDAKRYIALNSGDIDFSDLAGIDCDGYVTPQCIASTPEHASSTTVNGVTVEIAYPVADDSPLMASRQIGAPAQPATEADGSPCDRVGVRVVTEWQATFSRLIGTEELPADVHAVAMSEGVDGQEVALNLLVLDRTACMALRSSGGAVIRVKHLEYLDVDPDTPGSQSEIRAGVAASDSDGSECDDTDAGTSSAQAVIDVAGGGAIIADGLICDDALESISTSLTRDGEPLVAGKGCGVTAALAPDLIGGWPRWASPDGGVVPLPVRLPERLTRGPVDHRFNCDVSYEQLPTSWSSGISVDLLWATNPLTEAAGQDITDCDDAETESPHIYEMIHGVGDTEPPNPGDVPGVVGSWTEISGTACDVDGEVVFEGNTVVDCRNFQVQNGDRAIFTGNVIFNGALTLTGTGELYQNYGYVGADLRENSGTAIMFFRGTAKGKGNRTVTMNGEEGGVFLHKTTVYLSKAVESFSFNGGSGTKWVAPDEGRFRGLALWSDTDATHSFAGQAGSLLSGTFFTPWGHVQYSGGSNGEVVSAQFVSLTLTATGQGELLLQPSTEDAVTFKVAPTSALIR